MTYQFDIEIAKKYGVDSAVMIQNLAFWIKTNASNGKNFKDGRFWTYNSVKAYEKLFPFWSYKTIRRIIENLLKDGVLIAGNFNENTYDRTNWYSLSDELISILDLTSFFGLCICPNGQMEMPEWANGNAQMGESYKETYNKQDNKPKSDKALTFFENNSPSEWENFQMRFRKKFSETEWEKFKELFECKVDEEGLEFTTKIISARLTRFAINYCENLDKDKNKSGKPIIELKPAYMLKPLT
jgi:hypothetical protein